MSSFLSSIPTSTSRSSSSPEFDQSPKKKKIQKHVQDLEIFNADALRFSWCMASATASLHDYLDNLDDTEELKNYVHRRNSLSDLTDIASNLLLTVDPVRVPTLFKQLPSELKGHIMYSRMVR